MVKKKFRKWEQNFLKRDKLSLKKKYEILDGLYREAVRFSIFPPKDPLAGIEVDIKIARIVNRVSEIT